MFDVCTSYQSDGSFQLDTKALEAVGRPSDFSGCWLDTNVRDLGWECKTKAEAEKIKRALVKVGLKVSIIKQKD